MKKLFLVFFISFVFLLFFSSTSMAWGPSCDATTHVDPGAGTGIVPCGQSFSCKNNAGVTVACNTCSGRGGNVECTETPTCPCEFGHFGIMLVRIYTFAIKFIVIPVAGLAVVVAGLYMLVSAGNPAMFDRGKKIL